MKKGNLALSKISLINSIVTTLVLIIVFVSIGVYNYKNYYDKNLQELKNSFISKNKELIKNEVTSLISQLQLDVEKNRNTAYSIANDRLSTAINLFQVNSKNKDLQTFYKLLDGIIFDTIPGYFFILDEKGNILYHQENKELIGKNIYNLPQLDEGIFAIAKRALKQGYAKGTYLRDDFKNASSKRVLHINTKKLDNLPIFAAVNIYLDEIDEQVKKRFYSKLQKERFGYDGYGYFWVNDKQNKMIFHPYKKEMMGKNHTNFQDQSGNFIFKTIDDIIQKDSQGYLDYTWQLPDRDTINHKTSFVKDAGLFNWVIGAGFYLNDFEKQIAKEKSLLHELFSELIFSTALFLVLLFALILFISLKISKKFKVIEDAQKRDLNLLEQYKMILDKSTIVSKTDTTGKITYINELFEQISGCSSDFILGKTHRVIKNPSTPRDTFKSLWETVIKGETWQGIIKNRRRNTKESYYCKTTIAPIKDENGITQEYISVCIDITEIVEQKDKMNNIFLTDTLTSLGSRVKLLEDISKAKNSQIALIDVDRFTQINDTFGYARGDELLREVAKKLYLFTSDLEVFTYRIYSDVFVVYSTVFEHKDFEKMIKELIEKLSASRYEENENLSFSFTTGIAYGTDEILAYADMALNTAKKEQKSFVIYDENNTILNEFKDNFMWIKKLSSAVNENRIVPYFQPIYNYQTQKIEKYEALMRYIDEDGSVVAPFKFLDIAKKTKVYPQLTEAMVAKSADYFAQLGDLEFSVNLTLEDLLNAQVMEYIYSILQSHNLFEKVVLEIVESEELISFEQVKNILYKFQQKGVKIAIDDFGSGYSNYTYLLELEVDYIKIDGSIIKKLKDNQSSRDLVSSIVHWAKKSGVKTIAEFVSNEDIDKIVKELNIDYAQGYLYGKPEKNIQ